MLHGRTVMEHLRRCLIVLKRSNTALFGIRELHQAARNKLVRSVCVCLEVEPAVMHGGDKKIIAIDVCPAKHPALPQFSKPRKHVQGVREKV